MRKIALLGALAGLFALPGILENEYLLSILILVLFRVLLVSSLRLNHLMGFVSLGHVGFMLIGAYTSALLVLRLAAPIGLAILAAGLVSSSLALLLGYPFLRVKGIYFVILTFLMAETFRLGAVYANNLTGGATGLAQIHPLSDITLGPVVFSLGETADYYRFLLVVTVTVGLLLYWLERSRLGFYWKAIHESEALCASVGINTTFFKMLNFAIGAAIAGVTGALWAHYQTVLAPAFSSVFGVMSSIFLLVYMYAGGQEYFWGPVIGVVALTAVAEFARVDEEYIPMVLGAAMIGVVLLLPEGIMGGLERARALLLKMRGELRVDLKEG
jgi:branched-chain amino acid transport system permease protein